jgi:protease II
MPLKTILESARITLANRRTERRARQQLCAELAAFQTPAERAELDLILGRHGVEETREIREILNQQDYERQRAWPVVTGYSR